MPEKTRQIIMLVDDNQTNLSMGKNILKDFYEVYALPSAEKMFEFLENMTPDLILLDVVMPTMNGLEAMKILRADKRYIHIPVIFVTAKTEKTIELEGLTLGAVDYVTKPFSAAILLKRIENHLLIKNLTNNLIGMVREQTEVIEKQMEQNAELQKSIIDSIADIVEFRDSFTGGHISRTQQYMRLLVDYLVEHGVYADEVRKWENTDYVVTSAQLHDLGKIFISDTILNKPGKLTPGEFDIMKTHVSKGVEAIQKIKGKRPEQLFWNYAEMIAGYHHEKWNGSGYPGGLKGRDIPLLGRLMAIADVYDALTSTRPYKEPFSAAKSAEIIIDAAGTHFDPALVKVFKALEAEFGAIAESRHT
jgi:putative two-component system response regulator